MTGRAPTLLASLSLLLAASCSGPSKPAPVLDERHVITVDGTTVRYNGKLLDWNATVNHWEEVLGPASRKLDVNGGISVWDDLGVFLYYDLRIRMPESFVVLFSRTPPPGMEPHRFWPRNTFRGRLVVDGGLIHAGSTVLDLAKKGKPFRRGYLDSIRSYDLDGFYVRLDFSHDHALTDFSISPDPEDPAPKQAPKP